MNDNVVLNGMSFNKANVAYETGKPDIVWVRFPSHEYNKLRAHGWRAYTGVYAGKDTWMKMERPK